MSVITNFLKQSFSYRAAQRWNELVDDTTRGIDNLTLTSFKGGHKSIHVTKLYTVYVL